MITTKKKMNRALRRVLTAMPAIPYIMQSRRRTSIAAYVLSGAGLAMAGGIVALMLMSPRARRRALHAAKDTYGKVQGRIAPRREQECDDVEGGPMSNGVVDRGEQSLPMESV